MSIFGVILVVEVFVGTSGWIYDWNLGGSFDWYVCCSNLNAVELNASFYRFPFRNQVLGWFKRGGGLRWSIKVHRSITHVYRLSGKALEIWFKFYELFKPLDKNIDFYLFQLPPNFICRNDMLKRIEDFYREIKLGQRFAIEFRHQSCFTENIHRWGYSLELTIVSIDSPITTWITKTNDNIYLRLHGRKEWYTYEYSYNELKELAEKTLSLHPKKIYIFFNNNHWMLENAKTILNILKSLTQ